MPRPPKNQLAKWSYEAHKIMISLIKSKSTLDADDFYRACVAIEMPPKFIGKLVGNLFKTFAASGYISKSKFSRISERNSGSLIAIWHRGIKRLDANL